MLHGLIERVGNQGVHTYTELRSYLPDVTPAQRSKRHLAPGAAPHARASTCSADPPAEVLYVGTAVDLRRRVGQYFNGADPRTRMKEMASLATAVDHVECAHDLEAGVRELRLLAAHAPPYNRRSKFPAPLVVGGADRRGVPPVLDGARSPLPTAPSDRSGPAPTPPDAAALIARFTGVRTCTKRLGRSAMHGPRCPEREVAPCPAARGTIRRRVRHRHAAALAPHRRRRRRPLAAALAHIGEPGRSQPL